LIELGKIIKEKNDRIIELLEGPANG